VLAYLQRMVFATGASLLTFDSAEYALAGRELAETGRLMTPFVHPAALHAGQHPPFPLLAGHPLIPIANAVLFRLGGARPELTLVPGALALVLLVIATARLAFHVTRESALALAAGLTVLLSPWTLRFASEGLSEVPFAALVTLGLVLLGGFPERPRAIALGVVLGLAHLTRPVLVPMMPAWILGVVLLAPAGTRLGALARTLLGFAPFAIALAAYKAIALGSPFADVGGYLILASLTPDFAVARLNRMMPPPAVLPYVMAHPGELVHKVLRALPSTGYQVMDRLGRPFAALLALRVIRPGDRPGRELTGVVLVAAALLGLLAALTVPDPRMLFPLLPAFAVLALDQAWRILRALRAPARLGLALCLGLALAVPLPGLLRDWRAPGASAATRSVFLEREWRGLGAPLAALLPDRGVVASDAAPWIAWGTRRAVTLIPLGPDDLAELGRRTDLGAVVLTNEWLIHRPGEERWLEVFEGRATPAGWTRTARLRSGRLEAVVLRPGAPDSGAPVLQPHAGGVRDAEPRHGGSRRGSGG